MCKKPNPDKDPKKETTPDNKEEETSDEESEEKTSTNGDPSGDPRQGGTPNNNNNPGGTPKDNNNPGWKKRLTGAAIGATVGAGVALFAIPACIAGLGFTAGGIAAGSIAAKMM